MKHGPFSTGFFLALCTTGASANLVPVYFGMYVPSSNNTNRRNKVCTMSAMPMHTIFFPCYQSPFGFMNLITHWSFLATICNSPVHLGFLTSQSAALFKNIVLRDSTDNMQTDAAQNIIRFIWQRPTCGRRPSSEGGSGKCTKARSSVWCGRSLPTFLVPAGC